MFCVLSMTFKTPVLPCGLGAHRHKLIVAAPLTPLPIPLPVLQVNAHYDTLLTEDVSRWDHLLSHQLILVMECLATNGGEKNLRFGAIPRQDRKPSCHTVFWTADLIANKKTTGVQASNLVKKDYSGVNKLRVLSKRLQWCVQASGFVGHSSSTSRFYCASWMGGSLVSTPRDLSFSGEGERGCRRDLHDAVHYVESGWLVGSCPGAWSR